MQTQDMNAGSTEVALTQLSAIPPGNSSSYILQLDPSVQMDVLESSLVLNPPDMVGETVYEIQLDQYMMDERNLEVVNLQNAVTFHPQFLEEHQFSASFDTTTEVHYQLEDFSLNQLSLNNATLIPVTATPTEVVREPDEQETVPEFTIAIELATESDQVISQELNAIMPPGVSVNQDEINHTQSSSQSILCAPAEVSEEANVFTLTPPEDQEIEAEVVGSEGWVEIVKKTGEEESSTKEKSRVVWSEKKARKKSSRKETPVSTCSKFSEFACKEVTVSEYEAANNKEERVEVKTEKIKGLKKHLIVKKESTPKGRKTDHKPKIQDFDKTDFLEDLKIKNATRADLPFKCGICRASFDNNIDLQRHVKSHTFRSMAYMCQHCGRGFATHSNRKEHERIHTGDKPYVCPSKLEFCSRAYVQISNLKKHIQTHKDKNNLQCTKCNKQFVKESSLILHQRAHSVDRKFRCHICDRAYNYSSLLKRHMRVHTGENPYSCEDCGMQFHEILSLDYHRKKVHTGERPHRCDQCGRAFILKADLKKHFKIHLRDRQASAKSVPSNVNGASTDSVLSFKDEEPSEMMDDDFNNSSLIEFQHPIDESVEMSEPQHTGFETGVLVISETDLLSVTTNRA